MNLHKITFRSVGILPTQKSNIHVSPEWRHYVSHLLLLMLQNGNTPKSVIRRLITLHNYGIIVFEVIFMDKRQENARKEKLKKLTKESPEARYARASSGIQQRASVIPNKKKQLDRKPKHKNKSDGMEF